MSKLILKYLFLGFLTIIFAFTLYNHFKKPNDISQIISGKSPEKIEKQLTEIAANNLEADFHLGEFYYNNSKSDTDPILYKAIEHYQKAVNNGFIDAIFPLANIYNYCSVPTTNKPLASMLYQKVLKLPVDTQTKARAQESLNDIKNEMMFKNNNFARREPQIQIPFVIPEVIVPVQTRIAGIRNDSQNVHDSGLQKTFGSGFKFLQHSNRTNQKKIPQREVAEHIINFINKSKNIDPEVKDTAKLALEHIKKTNESISSINNAREMEILSQVFNRIYSADNKNNIDALKKNLVEQLADCFPKNSDGIRHPVCAQGRAARIYSIFQGIDPKSDQLLLKPKWALKEEINGMAAKVRDSVLKSFPKDAQEAYNNDGGDNAYDKNLAIEVTNKIKKEIRKKGKDDYVESGIMSMDDLNLQLQPILENI